jgi:SNF2 family DNA or RNA helicase
MLSTKAGGTGLNLVAADACVLMDLDFNPQNNRQAEDRIHRLGQTRDVTIYYMICRDTIEEKILEIDARKMQLDVKFGGNKQDADSKIMKWILDSKRPGMDEFISTQ